MQKALNWVSSTFSSSSSLKSVDTQGVPLDWSHSSPRFSLDSPSSCSAAMDYLEKEGYCIIANVMNDKEIETAKSLFWDHWEKLSLAKKYPFEIHRNDVGSFRNIPLIGAMGIINGWGIGQSDFLWYCRQNKNIRKVFEVIWGGEKALLTSFDGCGIFRPYHWKPAKHNNKKKNDNNDNENEDNSERNSSESADPLTIDEAQRWKTKNGWYHIDQNIFLKPNKVCVQGLLSLYDATPHTGGLVVIPGSHLTSKDLLVDLESSRTRTEYIRIPKGHRSLSNVEARVVQCKAGDFIVWDSRTIHCNTPSLLTPQSPPNELIRLVAYICMTPSSFGSGSPGLINSRKAAYQNNQTTNHWPHMYQPNDNPKDLEKKSFDASNKLIQALITGVDPKEFGVKEEEEAVRDPGTKEEEKVEMIDRSIDSKDTNETKQ